MLAVYVTGHGFGHATRTAEVLRVLRLRAPSLPIAVVGRLPRRLFDGVPGGIEHRDVDTDVGLAQRDALEIDEEATVRRWEAFAGGWEALVAAEAAWLRGSGARLVLGDIPPLAFAAAHAAGIPSVGLGNFSWDWIYAHLAPRHPALGQAAAACARAYRRASLLLQLPFAGDLSAFPVRLPIPMVARRSELGRGEVRRRLGLSPAARVVLLSFGGIGLPVFDIEVLGALDQFCFMFEVDEHKQMNKNMIGLSDQVRGERCLRYEDVVAAADVVITKPGYGIVTDAIAAGVRLLYTDRGDFPEYPILVEEMPRYLACRHVEKGDLLAGRFGPALDALLAQVPPPPPDLRGAEVAAAHLRGMLERTAG